MSKALISRRILSPCHCEDPTEHRLNLELDKALELDFNEIHLGNPMHNEARGNLDAFIEYEGFLKPANAKRALHHIRGQRRILDEFSRRAKSEKVKTYLWHHELWFPHAVQEAFRQKFTKDGGIDPVGPFARDYLKSRLASARKQLPSLDGLILTLAETTQVVYNTNATEAEAIEQTAAFLQLLDSSLRECGWDYVLRLFCWEEKEYRIMSGAIAQLSRKPVIMVKAVPFDWHLHFPIDPLIAKMRDQRLILELGTNNEYWGVNLIPSPVPDLYLKQIEEVKRMVPGLEGVASRTDRDDTPVWNTPNEINLWAVSAALHGRKVNGRKIAAEFVSKRYYPKSIDKVVDILLGAGEVVKDGYYERGRHISGTWLGTMLGPFGLFQQARDLFFTPEDTSFRKARQAVEAKARRLREEFRKVAPEFSYSDQVAIANSLELLEGIVRAMSLTCELLYGLRSAVYDAKWRKESAWKSWKQSTLELAGALERKFGSDLFDHGVFAQGNQYPGSASDRLRQQVAELPVILTHLEKRKKGKELLSKQQLTRDYFGKKCVELSGKTLKFSAKQSRNVQILVLRAGSEMAVSRPILIKWNDEPPIKKELGTFGWFKCCNGYRDFEVQIPAAAYKKGKANVELSSANPSRPVRLASIRIEERLSGTRGEEIEPIATIECNFPFSKLFKKHKKRGSRKKSSARK